MTGLLQWGIRHSVEVTNQLVSVERILEYSELETERQPSNPLQVADKWPSNGCIEFKNVTYKYFYEAEAVLHRISFIIQPKEKLGDSRVLIYFKIHFHHNVFPHAII